MAIALALMTGCAGPASGLKDARATVTRVSERSFPADALVIQRAILTARGRQFALNGYLALSGTGGKRLIVTQSFGQVLADLVVQPDGTVHVARSSPMLRPAWVRRYVAADLECLLANDPNADCPIQELSPTHFVIRRRRYTLDLQIVEIRPSPLSPDLFP
jgi:hypothetical protein